MAERDREGPKEDGDHAQKKTTLYAEADDAKRDAFLKEIAEIPLEDRVYIDESGVDLADYRRHGRAPRGQKVRAKVSGKRYARVNVIAALCGKKLGADFMFQGTTDTELFNSWVKLCLVPFLRKGQVVFMDNASFHKSEETRKLIEAAGCRLIFLPTYSPDFNPIEHVWHVIKSAFRALKSSTENLVETLAKIVKIKVS